MEKRTIKLKGNELGWILKLAQDHLISKSFVLSAPDELRRFLYELMGQFHEANFYAGSSDDVWILTNDISKQSTNKEVKNE